MSFLTLIIYILLREKLLGTFTIPEALLILRGLKCKTYFDNSMNVQEATKKQKAVLKKLGVTKIET